MRLCLDLTPLETFDRHGGVGRYARRLLEELVALPEAERDGIEVLAVTGSRRPPVPGEVALEQAGRLGEPVAVKRHRAGRRFVLGALLRRARVDLFHSTEAPALPL